MPRQVPTLLTCIWTCKTIYLYLHLFVWKATISWALACFARAVQRHMPGKEWLVFSNNDVPVWLLQVTKILKILEQRGLVKNVKSVQHANRKVYMLAELEPAREITGGAW